VRNGEEGALFQEREVKRLVIVNAALGKLCCACECSYAFGRRFFLQRNNFLRMFFHNQIYCTRVYLLHCFCLHPIRDTSKKW
jgi:hypothetical protein